MSPGGLKVVLAGAGTRGREHAEALAAASGLDLVSVVDTNLSAAQAVAEAFDCSAHRDLADACSTIVPAYVVLATPPNIRLAAMEAVCSVGGARAIAVEKPMALTLGEAEEMVALARRSGILLIVSHQLRYSPEFEAVHEAVQSGRIGTVQFLRAVCYGNLWNQGSHMVDVLRWIAGAEVAWVMSHGCDDPGILASLSTDALGYWRDPSYDGPMWSTHAVGFANGLQAGMQTGLLFDKTAPDRGPWLQKRVTVQGSDGVADARVAGYHRIAASGSGATEQKSYGIEDYRRATVRLHEAVVSALEDAVPHRCDANDAMHSLEALLACHQSLTGGGLVTLPLAEESTMPAATSTRRIGKVSVIIAIPDHRGYAETCVESWTRKQAAGPDRYEVILVDDGSAPDLDRKLERLLRAGDRLIVHPTDCEMALYHVGATAAAGDVLFFTEPHCVAESEALAELILYLEDHDVDGCCIHSTPICANRLALMESRMYDDGFVEWSAPDSWCKVIIRGFAISTKAYTAIGGFDHRYTRFSEWLLAAELHRQGYRLGYAPGASVQHVYTDTLGLLKPFIRTFTEGECLYRRTADPALVARYFGQPPEWGRDNLFDPDLARRMARTLRSRIKLFLLHGHSLKTRTAALRGYCRCVALGTMGRRSTLAASRWRTRLAAWRTRLWRWFSEERCYRAYVDFYAAYTSQCRVEFAVRDPEPAGALPPTGSYCFADLPGNILIGFHGPEELDGVRFRWSTVLGGISLDLEPVEQRILITAKHRDLLGCAVAVYLNEHLIAPGEVSLTPREIQVRPPVGLISRSGNWLLLHCMPMYGKEDPRELGLGLETISFLPGAGPGQ